MMPPTPFVSPHRDDPALPLTTDAPRQQSDHQPLIPPEAPPVAEAAHAGAKHRTTSHTQAQARDTRRRLSFSGL
jgi:hypothetical protein